MYAIRSYYGNVQHVSGHQLHVYDGLEGVDLQQIRVGGMLAMLARLTHPPAPPPHALNDEHIVLIQMGANAAASYNFV